jgi:RecA-family ATPase
MMDDFRDDFIRDEIVGDEDEAAQGAEILPFKTFNAAAWEGVPIAPRRWIVRNRIPQGEPGIMSGDGGTGKTTLATQLAVAIPAGLPDWIGGTIDAEGPAIVFSAEEKLTEMHRRTGAVLDHRGLSFKDLHGGLHFVCDEKEVVLGAVDRRGIVQPTMALLRLEKTIAAIRPAFVMIENAADVYGGNEIDRTNVTRFVRHILGDLTSACSSTIMLIQHPSVSGLNDGTGRSGSTGWNNSGRWRNNFTKLKDDDDALLRLYHVVKNNYGPDDEKVRLRWERGVFVPEGAGSTTERAATERAADTAYLACLDVATAQGINVFPGTGRGYAPGIFANMQEARATGIKQFGLLAAQERLFRSNVIWTEPFGPPSRGSRRIARKPSELREAAE